MSDALSIFAAAREAADATALTIGAERYTFARLAELTRARLRELPVDAPARPFALNAGNTLASVITLYALLEARRPALLLHPRLTAAELGEQNALAQAHRPPPADAAAVLFTSGTTGRPRAVVLTRAALEASAHANAANLGWRADDCWLLAMSLARIGGLSILTRCLAARRAVALAPAFDPALLPQAVDEARVTLASLVPTMLACVLDANPAWKPPPFLRAVLLGGAAAPPQLLALAAERRLPVIITYGCTETCSQVVATPYEGRFDTARFAAGRPLAGTEIRIADGRIHVRGPMLMAGYLGEPPLQPGDWFDTGDLGAIDAGGCLHVDGRRADLIVSGGENVSPVEVERVLEMFPGVSAAGVFGAAEEPWGQVVAAALVVPGKNFDEAALAEYLRSRLSPHKRPRRICLLPALPHTAAGKLDRAALPTLTPLLRRLAAGAPFDG